MVSGTLVSVAALGEEGGWRGYMMPKLINIMGRGKALLLGGIIWGLWHAPLTCIGHNFGTDYPGFPFVGIIKMCIFCTLMGIILTFLTYPILSSPERSPCEDANMAKQQIVVRLV
jgi:membrane protease YdiL (CAAX protease family)